MIEAYRIEFRRYGALIDGALAQVDDAAFAAAPSPDGNSIAVLLGHLTGNLRSRFTDFLTSDGEKPWRDRDAEFEPPPTDRAASERAWRAAWAALEGALTELTDADLTRDVRIRGVALTVDEALARSSAHLAYHAGQIVLLARMHAGAAWRSLSIPRGGSQAYNAAPSLEKGPGSA